VHAAIKVHSQEIHDVIVRKADVHATEDVVDDSPFSYGSTGKHNHGVLPKQAVNDYSLIVQALTVSCFSGRYQPTKSLAVTESQKRHRGFHAATRSPGESPG
jgi:hypothetical protein